MRFPKEIVLVLGVCTVVYGRLVLSAAAEGARRLRSRLRRANSWETPDL